MSKTCEICGTRSYSDRCFRHKERKPIKQTTTIKRVGKQAKAWSLFRKHYLALHPPNDEGYYECYICHKWILPDQVTLDHIQSRSSAPHLRLNEDNIAICCYPCNTEKGSLSLEQFLRKKA